MCQDIHQSSSMSQSLNAVKSRHTALLCQRNRKSVPVFVVMLLASRYNMLLSNQMLSSRASSRVSLCMPCFQAAALRNKLGKWGIFLSI